jgi:hypothetical protein
LSIKGKEAKMPRPIEEGDRVNVVFTDGSQFSGVTVLHVPSATGDLWYFEDTGGTIYAQNPQSFLFDFIQKVLVANEKAARHTPRRAARPQS